MSVQAAEAQDVKAQAELKDRVEKVDYKMVTFSLAGKEYGIDIMNVKEIASASRFTYVPNAAPFVRGVYNLRGDIISIIDLRTMFHLPAERKDSDALESLLILRIDEHVFGVIVDNIDKVVGVSRSNIQPPHPIFGDINVKYIKGIIENQNKLYIILNVEKLFSQRKEDDEPGEADSAPGRAQAAEGRVAPAAARDAGQPARAQASQRGAEGDVAAGFVQETLFSFKRFGVSELNAEWFRKRFAEWKAERKENDLQLRDPSEADEFLSPFYSPCTGELWSEEYAKAVMAVLPADLGSSINVWNPGCGKGYETYSLACVLKQAHPSARIKIWANDSDLLSISMAPNMVFDPATVPERYEEFMVKGRNGLTFAQSIRDSIFFEFHDVLNSNPVPPVDIVLCRDTVSFLSPADQSKLLADFDEKAKRGAAIVLGLNEAPAVDGWHRIHGESASVYIKGE